MTVCEKIDSLDENFNFYHEEGTGNSYPRKRGPRGYYNTFSDCLVLAAIATGANSVQNIKKLTSILSERQIKRIIRRLLKDGFIYVCYQGTKGRGKQTIYALTGAGLEYLYRRKAQIHHEPHLFATAGNNDIKHYQNVPFFLKKDNLICLFEDAIFIRKRLKEWGWYPRIIKQVLQRFSPSYIKKVYDMIAQKPFIINKGAYLYTVLINGRLYWRRFFTDMLKRNGLPEKFAESFKELLGELSASWKFKYILWFVFAIRKRLKNKKFNNITFADIMAIKDWIEFKMRPVDLYKN